MSKRFWVSVCAIAAAGAAQAADLSQAGPFASAEQIINARAQIREEGLEFAVDIKGGDRAGSWTVDLAPDFNVVSDNNFRSTIYDYALKRVIRMDDEAHIILNTSLYAFVAGRLRQKPETGTYTLTDRALTKEEAARLTRYLVSETALPAATVAEIAAAGRMPAHIAAGAVTMDFKPALTVKAVYPLRKGWKPKALDSASDPAAATLASLIQLMQTASSGTAPGRKSAADFRAAIAKALMARKGLQAVLLVMEMNEQIGPSGFGCPKGCRAPMDIVAQARKTDKRVDQIYGGIEPRTPDDAVKLLKGIDRTGLSNPYVIDELLANALAGAGHIDDAMPLYAAAIKGNPYAAGFYKGLGDGYQPSVHPELAWACYDIGRTLPDAAGEPVIHLVDPLETAMETEYPQYF